MKSKEILINKINFDINVTSTDSFEDFEKFIFKTYESNLNSIIQNIIDENKEIDDNILIDEIVIDLKEFNLKNFYILFAENLKDQLSRLKLPTKSKDYDFHTSFLKKGYYPWWYDSSISIFNSKKDTLSYKKILNLKRKYFLRYLNQLNKRDFNMYLKNLLNTNYFLFEDLYRLFDRVLYENTFNFRSEFSRKIFLCDYLIFFKSEITNITLKNLIIKFSKQFSLKFLFIINELFEILFTDDNVKKIKSYIFLKRNIEIIFKSVNFNLLNHNNKFPKYLIYSNYFREYYFDDLRSFSNFKKFYDNKYIRLIYDRHKDFDNYATYQLSEFIKSEKFFLYFLRNKYSKEESKILYDFKELLKTSKLITFLDKLSIQNNMSDYHVLVFYKYLISQKKRIELTSLFSSFLKKIAKQNKLDFYYFLLNFKLNTDLNLLNRSLANELLKLFNKELFTNEHISPILYKKSNKLIKHKRKYIEGTVHDAKIIDFNNEGGFIKISSEFRAFVPFEHLMKKDGSLLKKGEFAKFEVIEFNEKHQIFFMSHTYTFKKNDIKFIQNKSELRDVLLDYFKENNNINDLSEFKNDFLSFLKARKYIKDKSKLKDKFLDYLKEKKFIYDIILLKNNFLKYEKSRKPINEKAQLKNDFLEYFEGRKSINEGAQLKNDFLESLEKLKNKTIITNSYKKEFVDIFFSIFNLYKNNKKFNQYFKSHDDLYSFINDQLQSISLKTNFNSLLKVIDSFSSILNITTSSIIIKYFQSITDKVIFSVNQLNFIENLTYLILLDSSQISSVIYDKLIATKDIDKIIFLVSRKRNLEINKFEKIFYIPFIIKSLSEKTFESVIKLISKDKNNDYFDIYKLLVKNLEYQKLIEYEPQIKFYTLKILIENKKQLNRTFFIKEIFKSFFLVNVNLVSSLKSKLKNEDSLFEISNYINKIDYRKESLNNNEFFQSYNSNIKNIFQSLTSPKIYEKSSFSSNNFDFLLNLKNEINKSNTDLISSDFKYFDQIEDILSSSKNLIDFLELNIYDQELFHSLVELSILEDFNDEFIKIFDNLNRNLSFYEKLSLTIYNDFKIANLDKRAYTIILRSYVLKFLVSNQLKDFSYSEFYIGFLYYLFNNAKLNLRNLSKINSLLGKESLRQIKSITKKQTNLIFQDLLHTTNLFLEVNNFTGITKSQKESIYFKDLSYFFITYNKPPFWLKSKDFNQSDAFQIFEKLIINKKGLDFNYLFFNKSFLENIITYSKSSEYLFQSKLINNIKESIKRSKVFKFKNLYDSLKPVTKFDQFFESLINKIGEDSSKYDTIIQTEKFDIISYYLEFGSLELTFPFQSKNEIYLELINLYKSEKLKIKKLIYISSNNKQIMERLVSLFPDEKKEQFLDMIHPKLNDKIILLKQVIKKSYKKDLFRGLKFNDNNHLYIYLSFLWSKSNFIIFDIDKIIIELINNFFFKSNIKSDVFFNVIKKVSKKLNKNEIIFIDKIRVKYNLVYDPIYQEDFKKQNIKDDFKLRKKISNNEDIDSLLLKNVGLILLWPYMYMLCEKLGFLEKKQFVNETVRQKAILLTQYIVTGSLEFKEEELILNKIIFGVGVDYLVDCSIDLMDHELEICNSLLKSVLLNWKKMENTSVQTFRDSFLIRDGLLSNDKENFVLHVDKNPYDVLLSTLPWSIANVQTLFMKNKIIVNWV